MEKYLTFREKDDTETLRYYIVQKQFPHNLAIILSQPKHESLVQSVLPGYNLWVVHHGVLRGNFIAIYPSHKEELQVIYDEMANWFYSERILKDEKRYEKFKVK